MSDNDLRKQAAEAEAMVRANITSTESTDQNSAKLRDPVKSTFTYDGNALRDPSFFNEGADMTSGSIISNGEIIEVKKD